MLTVKNLKKTYPVPRLFQSSLSLQALRGISFDLSKGEILAIVGESGCGKSTLGRILMGLEEKTDGEILVNGKNISELNNVRLSEMIQMIFQDPHSSLNPRKTIYECVAEPLIIKKIAPDLIKKEVYKIAEEVGLRHDWLERYPHMLSGGQKQRVGIARALITQPQIIICDEPVSALDVSVQAQVLNLIVELRNKYQISFIFISHDLHVVQFLADQVAVLYLGEIVEYGSKENIFKNPQHPYTKMLIASIPKFEKKYESDLILKGELPSPLNPPDGCSFHTRCSIATARCSHEAPKLEKKYSRMISCHEVQSLT